MRLRTITTLTVTLLSVAMILILHSSPLLAGKRPKKQKGPDVERRSFELLMPAIELEPTAEYPESQTIGGVRVELSRIPIESTLMYHVNVQQRTTKWGSITGLSVGGTPVWVGVLPYYALAPESLQFKVRITNQLGRVLRLQNVALQFTKDGETISTDYAENDLNKVMVLPNKSWEGVLYGPSLEAFGVKAFDANAGDGLVDESMVASDGVLLLGLYDVITELDAASNPTTRSNFEWVFGYTATTTPKDVEAIRWKAKMTPEQAAEVVGERPADQLVGFVPGG